MSRLSINARLALPGLMLLSRDLFFDSIKDEELLSKYLADTIKCFKRFEVPTDALCSIIENLYSGNYVEVEALRKDITAFVKLLTSDSAVHITLIELFKASSSTMAGDNKAYLVLRDKASLLSSAEILSYFPFEVDTTRQAQALGIVAQYNSEELAKLREEKSPEYKLYLAARKAGKSVVNDYIRLVCRQAGGKLSYATIIKLLEEEKLQHTLPTGFSGYIDEFANLYTLGGRKLAAVPHGCVVVMNGSYDNKADNTYVCTAKSPLAKSAMYVYTADFKQRSKENKFKVVKALSKDISKLRKDWLKLLKPNTPNFEAAVILELVYQTQARIGDEKNATLDKRTQEYKKTYGISTILGSHVWVDGHTIHIQYPGKAAFKGDTIHLQKHVFEHTKENEAVYRWLSIRAGKDEKVFSISAQKVRDLLADLGAPEGTTIHKLRTLKGTLMMQEKIKSHPFKTGKTTATAVSKWLKEEALDVGIQLGHMSGEKYTASTAIAHYIDPVTMMRLYKEARVVAPKTMLKLVGIDPLSLETVK